MDEDGVKLIKGHRYFTTLDRRRYSFAGRLENWQCVPKIQAIVLTVIRRVGRSVEQISRIDSLRIYKCGKL